MLRGSDLFGALSDFPRHYALQPKHGRADAFVKGTLALQVDIDTGAGAIAGASRPACALNCEEEDLAQASVTIDSAKGLAKADLIGQSDPYCKVRYSPSQYCVEALSCIDLTLFSLLACFFIFLYLDAVGVLEQRDGFTDGRHQKDTESKVAQGASLHRDETSG